MDLVKEILSRLKDGNYHSEEKIDGHSEGKIIYRLRIMSENDLASVELEEVASRRGLS